MAKRLEQITSNLVDRRLYTPDAANLVGNLRRHDKPS